MMRMGSAAPASPAWQQSRPPWAGGAGVRTLQPLRYFRSRHSRRIFRLLIFPRRNLECPGLGAAFAMQNSETDTLAKSTILTVDPRSAKAVLVAVGCTVAALAARWIIGYIGPGVSPFPVFLASTLVAAAWAGIPAGACVATLGFLLSWLFFSSSSPGTFSPAGIAFTLCPQPRSSGLPNDIGRYFSAWDRRDLAFRRQLSFIQEENDALAQIASDVSLTQTLGKLTQTIERYCEGRAVATVMLLDPDSGRLVSAWRRGFPKRSSRR